MTRGSTGIMRRRIHVSEPIAKLAPVDGAEGEAGIFDILAGTVTVRGNLVAPTGEAWEAND